METEKEVKVYRIDYKCPQCEEGYLRSNGVCLTSNPPQYPHECNKNCGYKKTFRDKTYPYTEYRNKE